LYEEVFLKNKHGQTSLHKAASSGDHEKILELVKKGIDVNIKDNAGWTPLHEASLAGNVKIVDALLKVSGAHPTLSLSLA